MSDFFHYEHKNLKPEQEYKIARMILGIVYRMLQLGVIIYTFVYVILLNAGYQDKSGITSFVMTDVNGIVKPNSNVHLRRNQGVPNLANRAKNAIDAMDYVLSAQQIANFFIITKQVEMNQVQKFCPEGASVISANCTSLVDTTTCQENKTSNSGIMTGKCVENPKVNNTFVCQVKGWCPVPENCKPSVESHETVFTGTENATVQILNNVAFTLFSEKTQNVPKDFSENGFLKCLYDKDNAKFCPVFQLGSIVQEVGENYSVLAETGGVILITISWDCNLDYDVHECAPTYQFSGLNERGVRSFHATHADKYQNDRRTLYNATGIYFLIQVEGFGRKFNMQKLVVNSWTANIFLVLVDGIFKFMLDKYYSWSWMWEKLVGMRRTWHYRLYDRL